jgi:AraC-like DNA-binding protein
MEIEKLIYRLPLVIFRDFRREDHPNEDVVLTYASHNFLSGETFTEYPGEEFLGLHFNLGVKSHHEIDNHDRIIKTNQYNLIYTPPVTCNVGAGTGEFCSLHIFYPFEFLKLVENDFEVLKKFLEAAKQKKRCVAVGEYLTMDATLRTKMDEFIHHQTGGHIFLNFTVFDLLLRCLKNFQDYFKQQGQCPPERKLKKNEVIKLEAAKKYLEAHYDERLSLDRVAYSVDMDVDRLRVAFKKYFKTSMRDFVMEQRLTKGLALLLESNMPIESISNRVGYKNPSHFSFAFKKKFGYHPRKARKEHTDSQQMFD